MDWNRTTKRTKVKVHGGRSITILQYLTELRDSLPKIEIAGKPMDHETGLVHCVLLSKNWNELASRIAVYTAKVYHMYEGLVKDKEEFEKKHGNTDNSSRPEGDSGTSAI